MINPRAEYEQLLRTFFYELEKEFHDGVDSGNCRWRQKRYKLWARMGSRKQIRSMEEWFKGEIAIFLNRLQNTHQLITEWNSEFPSGSGRVDNWVHFGKNFPPLVLEVKCLVEGFQGKGNNPDIKNTYYTTSMDKVAEDLAKSMPDGAQLYSLLFMYPPPSEKRLEAIKKSLNYHLGKLSTDIRISWKDPYYISSEESGLYIGKVELSCV